MLLLNEPRPVWIVEIVTSARERKALKAQPDNISGTFDMFWKHGYECWTIEPSPWKIKPVDLLELQSPDCRLSEIHNFLFK